MRATSQILFCSAVLCLLTGMAPAQTPAADEIVANQNRTPAGKMENGILTVHLELRKGTWYAEADDGPKLFVQAFGEAGQSAQIPGPLLRMPEGTTIHLTVTNKLKKKATVYGLNTRPGDPKAGLELAPGESHESSFAAGAPGTYYYWARTATPEDSRPYLADAQLNGAYIVDPLGAVPADRIFIINTMFVLPDALHPTEEVVSINGKSYPYTEPLEYAEGETIRWRVINASGSEHPMHLHGAFYQLLSLGDFESDTPFADGDRQSVVTEDLMGGHTMMMEWKPQHVGRWLFHCHFQAHFSVEERVPVFSETEGPHYNPAVAAAAHEHHDAMGAMNDMAGLVMVITVKPAPVSAPAQPSASAHKLDLVIEPTAAEGKSPTFSCAIREGKKIVASADKSIGPPIVVTRGEPTEITVTNHLREATTIHWHGLELDSYYDGVIGGGTPDQVTPAIPPGSSFTARFTPNRAGTFIYHTHAADPDQLTGGVYGALIVLEPGETFDPQHDKLLVLGARDANFFTTRITMNGDEVASPVVLSRGVRYRLRLINIAPNLVADFQIGTKERPATWRAVAKDGATLPPRLAKTGDAILHIASGETYDFEFQSDVPGATPLQAENSFNQAKLLGKIIVQ
jgi:manganese oxidase